ncbi:MAG: Gfo/Idh/MocA family oxidoreductase [Bacteroidales bacterium]|nr:Gfo/Idh/MocA family oxidoreductase [Bacteroidales bacterium]
MEKQRKIRFGVVGSNFVTDWVLEGGKCDSRFEATALYSRTPERAKEYSEKHRIPYSFTSLEAMLESGLVDAVYIASPNACHAEQSILCMEHGKHVLCEKPLAGNAREVERMIRASRDNGVVLMEAMKNTLSPGFDAIRRNLPRIGKVRRYVASYCQYSSRYDKLKEGIVLNAFKPELCNGALMDIGVYTIFPLIALFGKPLSVKASGLLLPTGADGEGCALMGYDDMDAVVFYSKITDSYLPSEIQGEEGSILIDRINSIGEVRLKLRNGTEEVIAKMPETSAYFYEIAEFINVIVSGRGESFINSCANSLATAEVMDVIRKQIGVVYPIDK